MREMKDSGIEWIGAIPQEWITDRLQWHLKEINVSNNPIQTQNILSLTIEAGVIPYAEKGNQGNKAKEDYSQYKIAFPDTLVINSMNVIIGAVGISKYFGCVSPVYYVFEPIEGTDLRYIYYLFTNTGFQKEMRKYAKGIMEIRLRISSSDMLKRIVPIPSFEEQQRIADNLDKMCAEIDAVLEKTRASIEEYKKLKQAVITQAVTKGVRGDRPMKNSGIEWIGEIANEFAVYKFKYLLKTPMQYGANEAGITFDKTLPRYIRITDITSDGRLKQDNRLCIEDTVAKPYILQDGDLLFARSGGTVGKSFLYKQSYGNAAFAGYLIRAVVNRTIAVPEYVYYYTNSSIYDTWKNSIFIQSTIQNIGADRYSNMPIIVPNNIEEQRSIVEYLNERCVGIDALIRKKQQHLTEIENYKKSLIYEYVTGKKEVV